MKKIIIAIAVALLIVGCRNTCILHTYYGDFDTDTLKSCLDDTDGISCYLVHTESSDTFRAKQGTIYTIIPRRTAIIRDTPSLGEALEY